MRSGGGSHKGAGFERTVCVELSLWVSRGRRKDLFWRTAMSGGRATVHRQKDMKVQQCGDVCAVASEGHPLTDKYLIECKHVRNLSIGEFLFKHTGPLARFWVKALEEAKHFEKIPMIIARQNRFPTLIITPMGHQLKAKVLVNSPFGCEIGLYDVFLTCPPHPDLAPAFPPIPRKRLNV